jgi:hypothetical protein
MARSTILPASPDDLISLQECREEQMLKSFDRDCGTFDASSIRDSLAILSASTETRPLSSPIPRRPRASLIHGMRY